MSFQGAGTGLTGAANQLNVGYAQSSGYTGYAASAGNINGYAPQAGYANQTSASTQTLQLTSIQGNTQWGWQGQQSNPSHLWGSNQGTVHTVFNPGALQVSYSGYAGSAGNINGYAPQAGYANSAATAPNINSMQGMNGTQWAWAGQGGTPSWLWGGNVGSQYAVWAPNQMYVGQVGYAGYAGSAGNINGYAPVAGYANQLNVQGIGGTTWSWQGQGGTPNHFWGSNDGSYMPVWQAGQMTIGYSYSSGTAYQTAYSPQSSYATSVGGFNGQMQNWAFYPDGSFSYNRQANFTTGNQVLGLYNQSQQFYGIIWNFKRSTGGNTGDRFWVYYNPENNNQQYGYFNGNIGSTSDSREKEEIDDIPSSDAYRFIKMLRPRKFKWKHRENAQVVSGFIAQEVLEAVSNTHTSFHHIVNHGKLYLSKGGTTSNIHSLTDEHPRIGLSQEVMLSPLIKTVQALIADIEKCNKDLDVLERLV